MAEAFVQGTGAQSSGTVSSTVGQSATFSSGTTTGHNFYVFAIINGTSHATAPVVSDNQGNTYAENATSVNDNAGNSCRVSWFQAKNGTGGGTHTITVKPASGSAFVTIAIVEASGIDTITGIDAAAATGATSSAPSTGNVAVNHASELVLGGMTHNSATVTLGVGSGVTQIYLNGNASNMPIESGYSTALQSSAFAVAFTSSGSVAWQASGISLLAGGAAAVGMVIPRKLNRLIRW